MAIPVIPDFAASQTVDEDDLDDLGTAIDFLYDPPRCYCYRASDGALASASWNAVNFANEAYDSHNQHDNATNNTRLPVPEDGLYVVTAHLMFQTNSSGIRGLDIRKNANGSQTGGTDVCLLDRLPSGTTEARIAVSLDVQLVATDYLELFAFQNSGGSLNVIGGIANTFLSYRWSARTVS